MSNSMNKVNYDERTQIAKQLHFESEDCTRLNSQTRQSFCNFIAYGCVVPVTLVVRCAMF